MMKKSHHSIGRDIDFYISVISSSILAVIIAIVFIAIFDRSAKGEAPIGSFNVNSFNKGWIYTSDGTEMEMTLPSYIKISEGQMCTITNTLPEDLSDNMSFLMRASMEDIYVYVDGELRSEYSTDSIDNLTYYIPSAYVVTKLNTDDSGKEIKINIRFKSQGIISDAKIGYGNDVWYSIVVNNLPVNIAALIVLILGAILSITLVFINKTKIQSRATRYLGFLMLDVAMWVLSESAIRQLIFARASLSGIFAYLTAELSGVFAIMYFDEVQHRKHHKMYRIGEAVMLSQILINITLSVMNVKDLYKTLIYSHILLAVSIIIGILCVVKDVISKDIMKYRITAIGMICFLELSIIEIAGFYVKRFHVFGTFVCVGLILLMTFTIVQALMDEVEMSREREKKQIEMLNNTIETIAGSIDAKDEYTGGHSERVGIYAEKLARKIAAEYGFSEEDILRIKYIGFVHDIGKIGVADTVLNKAGRLTDEEFSLMKKHTEIGYEIMGATGEIMEGILDGIRYHHERFDGKGYPKGLAYTDIPLIARILSLADSYDAMTSNRVYRKRLTDEEVRNELLRCSGTQFDPALTDAFVKLIDEGELVITTDNGMATDKNGNVLISAKLENRLHSDLLLNKADVTNPTHVRMMCYVIKLMERKGKNTSVIFCGPDRDKVVDEDRINEIWSMINTITKGFIASQDMIIKYSNELNVMAVFDREEIVIKDFIKKIYEEIPDSVVFRIDD